jgi:hypothetical protein
VIEIRIYFEGSDKLRPGFSEFFRKAVPVAEGIRVRCVACRDRARAVRDFVAALDPRRPGEDLLLIDSDGPDNGKLYEGLKLPKSRRNSVFWMVQVMESWFLADPEALARCYGNLNRAVLKDHQDVEKIAKSRVESILKQATKDCGRRYDRRTGAKTTVAPKVLAALDPEIVRKKARNCDLLLSRLKEICHGR